MHEASLARALLAAALDGAGDQRITAVRGWVAEDEALSAASLQLHFDGLATGTRAVGARLELELVHLRARCSSCAAEYAPDHHVTLCPRCGSTDAELLGRRGLGIHELDVE